MLDKLKEFLKKVEDSKEFKNWRIDHEKAYFCSAFLLGPELNQDNWQIDFYNQYNDKITSFIDVSGAINFKEENIFKKPEDKVEELDLDKIKIDLDKALNKFEKVKKKKYPKENPTQKIVILQKLDFITWNITYINTSLNILNIKINAVNGRIIEESLTSVMKFKDQRFNDLSSNKKEEN